MSTFPQSYLRFLKCNQHLRAISFTGFNKHFFHDPAGWKKKLADFFNSRSRLFTFWHAPHKGSPVLFSSLHFGNKVITFFRPSHHNSDPSIWSPCKYEHSRYIARVATEHEITQNIKCLVTWRLHVSIFIFATSVSFEPYCITELPLHFRFRFRLLQMNDP